MTKAVEGLSALLPHYDGFILDLWGVIHDGGTAYPGAVGALKLLQENSKRWVFLSNAPRRSAVITANMVDMGIPEELARPVISSGEVVHQAMRDRRDPDMARLGTALYHLGPDRDRSVFDTLDIQEVDAIAKADFILNTGLLDFDHKPNDYDAQYKEGVACGLPMVCANPDRVVIREGRRIFCAGAMADRYIELGGSVIWRGKPDATVYRACLDAWPDMDPARIAVVGDSFDTDMPGGSGVGLDTVFVAAGIHGEVLGATLDGPVPMAAVNAMAEREGVTPTWAIPSFRK